MPAKRRKRQRVQKRLADARPPRSAEDLARAIFATADRPPAATRTE